jgi:hypothetical protein
VLVALEVLTDAIDCVGALFAVVDDAPAAPAPLPDPPVSEPMRIGTPMPMATIVPAINWLCARSAPGSFETRRA